MQNEVLLRVRFTVDDAALSALHTQAFAGHDPALVHQPWAARLERHSLTWIGAFDDDVLVGFVHACWDGGSHAFLLDTAVAPAYQRRGIGRRLVLALIDEVAAAGCPWLHVDFEPHLAEFYRQTCGFADTEAGLLNLAGP